MLINRMYLLVFMTLATPALAANLCQNADGTMSLQEQPCISSKVTEPLELLIRPRANSLALNNVETHTIAVAGVGEILLTVFSPWDFSVIQTSPETAPTASMVSKTNDEALSLQMTFLQNASGLAPSDRGVIDTVRQIGERYVAGSIEQNVSIRKLRTRIGNAFLANFSDQKYLNTAAPTGEYSSITVGLVAHPQFAVSVTILSNGMDSSAHNEALAVISSISFEPILTPDNPTIAPDT